MDIRDADGQSCQDNQGSEDLDVQAFVVDVIGGGGDIAHGYLVDPLISQTAPGAVTNISCIVS